MTKQFLGLGHRVELIDIDRETLPATEIELDDRTRLLALVCDVAESRQVRGAVEQVEMPFGRNDALVNNAGVVMLKKVLDTTYEEWSRALEVNLTGAFICTQACAPAMLKGGDGSVVNIVSISGVRTSTLRVAYGTSKAALMHLTKQQAIELDVLGIRVNAIAPDPVDTAMAKAVLPPDIRADYHRAIPLYRYGSENQIASAVTFLRSEAARYIIGQTLAVDGGFDPAELGLPELGATK